MRRIPLLFVLFLINLLASSQQLDNISFKKGLDVKGGINVANIFYNTNDTIQRRDPFQTILTGNLNINLFGYDMPFTFTYTNSQRSYTQPFNRFVFSPGYKWVKLYLGSTSMTFSPYTLAGHTFSGAGAELSPGNWRFAIMGGRLRKAVNYDPLHPTTSIPSYKRMGYGIKAGFDKGDQAISVNIFTAKDDVSSINKLPPDRPLHPQQNLAVGFSGRTTIKKHFIIDADYTVSVLNGDIRALATTGDSLNTINDGVSGLSKDMPNRRVYDAFNGGIGYQSPLFGVSLRYERVAPDYQTLGGYYFNNDLENFTIAPNARFFGGKVNVAGNVGLQYNNLDNSRESTTRRWVGNGNVNYVPNEKWNATFTYSNFSTFTRMKPLNDPFFKDDMDSLNFYQVSNSFSGSVTHLFGGAEAPQSVLFSASYQNAHEMGNGGALDNKSGYYNINTSYSRLLPKPGISFATSYNMNISDAPGIKSVFHGPALSANVAVFKKMARIGYTTAYNQNITNNVKGSPVYLNGINVGFNPGKKAGVNHNLTFNASWVQRFKSEVQKQYRSELTLNLNYSVSL